MDGERNLQWRVVGDDVVVLDEERREVHRIDVSSAANIVDADGALTRRRLIAAAAAGIVITTVALPSAAAAASNDGVLDPTDTPAATPTGVAASSGGPTSIFVSWNSMNEVSGYRVVYGTTDPPTIDIAASTSALTISGLDAGTTYYVQVYAFNDASPLNSGGGPRSAVVTVTTDSLPAAIAAAATTAEVSDDTLTISWTDPASGSSGYKVYWRKTGTSSWSSKPNATSPTVITGLDRGFIYEFYVARTGNGWESPAPTTPETSPVIPVPNVTGFAAGTNITDAAPGVNLKGFTWMRLKWDAVTGTSPTYQVQRFVTPNWTNVGSPTASTSAVVTGLTDNTSQQFRIVTVINANSSSGSSVSTDSTHRVPTVTGTGNTVSQLGTAPDLIWECDLIADGSVTIYGDDAAVAYAVIGGGGGGGGGRRGASSQSFGGGGGGGGAVVTGSTTLGAGTYSATVGTGGSAGVAGKSSPTVVQGGRGGDGGSSSLALATSVSAAGGGGGGGATSLTTITDRAGNAGGCGGGAGAGATVSATGGGGSVGSDGQDRAASATSAAGGFGGGASGTPDGTPTATGKTWATADGGDNVTYGAGGSGGSGTGNAVAPTARTGGGGGGGGENKAGAAGAAGIVIVRVSEYAR